MATTANAWNTAILYGYVAAGSVLGGVARYLLSLLIQPVPGFPWATLFVNVTGSFIIGFYSTLSGPDGQVVCERAATAVRHDGILRGLHDVLDLQPRNVQAAASRHGADRVAEYRRVDRDLAAWPCGWDMRWQTASIV